MGDILGDSAPLPTKGSDQWFKVRCPKGEEKISAVLLGRSFFGVNTHFTGQTVPHNERGICTHCQAGLPIRWNGYIAAYDVHRKENFVLSLSEQAGVRLNQLSEQFGRMRGLQLIVMRARTTRGQVRKNAAIVLEYVRTIEESQLPPDFDVRGSLNRLFGINQHRQEQQEQQPEPRTRYRRGMRPDERLGWIPEAG
jgi:hypothetical protein